MLLNKIVSAKKVRVQQQKDDRFMPTLKDKWVREETRINDENKKMANRVLGQKTCLKTWQDWNIPRESPRRVTDKTFYESRLKERKLPTLIDQTG